MPATNVGKTSEKRQYSKGKRLLGRPRSRWEDNIRVGLKGICVDSRNWVGSDKDMGYWRALVNAA